MSIKHKEVNIYKSIMIKMFNNGYLIAILLFFAGSIGTLCDGIIASRGLGVAELAAIGITYPYVKAMECISLMFSGGSQIIIGRKIGQNKFEEISKVFFTSLLAIISLAIGIAILVAVFASPVSMLFGADSNENTLKPSMDYLISLAIGAPAHLATLYMIPLLQIDEKERLINIATVVMTVVNLALNILFLKLNFGIKGIGYSTSISYYVAFLILSVYFFEKKKGLLLSGSKGVYFNYIGEIVREGAPSAFKNVTSIVYNTVINNILAMTGSVEALAAFSLFKMTKFIFLSVSESIISPVRMIQSMLYEEKNRKMLRKIFRYSIVKGTLLSGLLSLILWVFGREIYSSLASGIVLDETVTMMRWSIIIYLLNTFVCYYMAYFQAIGKKKLVYSVSVVLNIVILPIAYMLADTYGPLGVWISLAVQFIIVTVYILGCAYFLGRKNKNVIDKLLALPPSEVLDGDVYDFHVEAAEDAKYASEQFAVICSESIRQKRKSYYCSLALEEILYNIIDYQESINEFETNIDVHIILHDNDKMILRVKDCSKERNPFKKYEYSKDDDNMDNIGIKIIKSLADDVDYSFVYGVNFITITVPC